MLMQHSHLDGRERIIVRDQHGMLIVERDGDSNRVVSWPVRRDDARQTARMVGRTCRSSCAKAVGAMPPVPVRLTIDRHREVVHWWSMVLSIMAERPRICARCSLITRWCGLFWCGVPAPVRVWRQGVLWIGRLASIATGANVGGDVVDDAEDAGCGCCLNLKWRLLETPRAMMRRLAALLLLTLTGEVVALESGESACPYGLWPSAL